MVSESNAEQNTAPESAAPAAEAEQADAKQSAAKKTATRKPAAQKKPAAKRPAAKRPAAKKPAAKKTSTKTLASEGSDEVRAKAAAAVAEALQEVAQAKDEPALSAVEQAESNAEQTEQPAKKKPSAKNSSGTKAAAEKKSSTAKKSAATKSADEKKTAENKPTAKKSPAKKKAEPKNEPKAELEVTVDDAPAAAETNAGIGEEKSAPSTMSLFDELNSGSPFEVPSATLNMLFQAPTEIPAAAALDAESKETTREQRGQEEQGTSRRRRRRRRGEEDMEIQGGAESDPPGTITKVRAPRNGANNDKPVDHVVAVKGSTRLEAKRQRRRESRETGRRRHSITEAEFLARRESVDRQMVVRQNDERIQIGVMEDGVLAEHFVSHTTQDSMIGNVYVGKVQNVLPSMEAAFVDIGRGRNAVLYAGEVDWAKAKLDGKPRRIENALKSGDTVLVQVTKDPVGHKGARLTSQISLPGRYLVYVPAGSMTGISRKLPDTERARLKKVLKEHLPDKAGVIVRTAAEGASEQELMNDINRLRVQWEGIEKASTSTKTKAPELLYAEPDLTIKVVRDVFNEDFSKLVVQGEHAWDTIEAYVTYVAPDLVDRLEKWEGEDDIFTHLRVDEQIAKALERKVNLPSGGSLVIDRTEAMTVIDVNTGKFTGSGGNLEETVTKNNLEAAEEIVRQMRLRDMGGIIVIDFIDMVLESNRDLVLRRLVECLGRDRTKHQVAEVTSLGLVQMTRKKIGTGLLEVFSENCEACAGRGVVIHDEPLEGHSHQPQVKQISDRPTRSERRRNRPAQEESKPKTQESTPVDPEEEERAQKARVALASIAAASGHAGEVAVATDSAEKPSTERGAGVVQEGRGGPTRPEETASESSEQPSNESTPDTEGDEQQRPKRRRRRGRRGRGGRGPGQPAQDEQQQDSEQPRQQQGDKVPDEPKAASVPSEPSAAEPKATSRREPRVAVVEEPAAAPKRPARRRRAASSAGGADASVTVVNAEAGARGTTIVSTSVVTTNSGAAAEPKAAEEPVMLGVGVPASEL
ncbi:Rne/Rng family ribonuclease [Galactobacter sp.]|uniref:Rne/Rng family ribonuclease n=1 Tax=Galactobacter sp. TaxID=2676125 RepID=UPI0025B82836|nr:Rne/Rng family ribonuclease [Galactobacter sp.]